MKISKVIFTFLIVFTFSILNSPAENKNNKILGEWKFLAPSAQKPYDRGLITLKEVDQKLIGEFTIEGMKSTIPQIKFKNDSLTLGFKVENVPIVTILIFKDSLFEGAADTPNGLIKVTAKLAKTAAN